MKATILQLSQIPLFDVLSIEDLERLQPYSQIQSYQRGEIIFHEGDLLPANLHILVRGMLQVQKIAVTGKETILRTLETGDIFAAPALFGDKHAPATVLAIKDCQILTISKAILLDTIQQTPELALQLLGIFNQRLQQLHRTVHGLVSERAIVRLARLIQYSVWQHGTDSTTDGEQLRIELPYYQMARRIGITYEECARLMKGLQDTVKYSRGGKMTILDWERLDALSTGNSNSDREEN